MARFDIFVTNVARQGLKQTLPGEVHWNVMEEKQPIQQTPLYRLSFWQVRF